MRALLVTALGLAACTPPEVRAPAAVNAPVLSVPVTTTPFPTLTLTGAADDATIIRLYVDEQCAGPVLRELSAETLRAGVELELVPRAINVFTARAYSTAGVRSECSEAVRVESAPLDPPPKPTLMAQRTGPLPTNRFRLFGTVDPQPTVLVRLFVDQCGGSLIRTMTPAEFAVGTRVMVPSNTFTTFYAQTVDATSARSLCTSISVTSDDRPPGTVFLRVASPNPVSGGFAAVGVSGFDVVRVHVFEQPRCRGGFSTCDAFSECFLLVPLNTPVVEWSALVEDGSGNSRCVDSDEKLIRDDSLGEQAPELEVVRASEFSPWMLRTRLQVWSNFSYVQYFAGAGCEGTVDRNALVGDAYLQVAVDPGTVWSAQMATSTAGGTVFYGKCSNTVEVPTQ